MKELSVWSLALRHPGRIAGVAVLTLVVGVLGWSLALLVQTVVDRAGDFRGIGLVATAIGTAGAIRAGLNVLRRRAQLVLVHRVEGSLQDDYMAGLLKANLLAVQGYSEAELYRRLRGLDLVRFALEERALGSILDAGLVVVATSILAFYSPPLAVLSLVLAALPAALVWAASGWILRTSKRHQEELTRLTESCMDTIRGLRDARLLGAQLWLLERMRRDSNAFHSGRGYYLQGLITLQSVTGFLGMTAGILVLAWGSRFVAEGSLTSGGLMFVFTLSGMILQPLEQFVVSWFAFDESRVALDRYREIQRLPEEPSKPDSDTGEIVVEGLSFSYGSGAPVLQNVTFKVPAGTSLAIVGESGVGKSTLLSLLAGLYSPDSGHVRIDRSSLGVVPQNPHFFEASLRENLSLGGHEVPEGRLWTALAEAGIDEFVRALPEGLDTPVRREGSLFSAGQLQRLALARALVRKPRILLLDEATSHVDPDTEEAIWNSLQATGTSRTTVFVTHRLATSARADRIAVLSEGRLIEIGSRDELLARRGAYRALWRRQLPIESESRWILAEDSYQQRTLA